jgi:hypothetical protein
MTSSPDSNKPDLQPHKTARATKTPYTTTRLAIFQNAMLLKKFTQDSTFIICPKGQYLQSYPQGAIMSMDESGNKNTGNRKIENTHERKGL